MDAQTLILVIAFFVIVGVGAIIALLITIYNEMPSELRSIRNQLLSKKYENVKILQQSDFSKGTYRIKESGIYILGEDIIFDPYNPTMEGYTDISAYVLGFFAAITVEVNDVVIELNGKTLSQSDHHFLHQRFYSNIELASSPFMPSQGPADFGSITSPKNIIVKNGYLGQSSHHGIHGNGNENVYIYNIRIHDFEIAGLAMNGVHSAIIENVNIGPNHRAVKVTAKLSHIHFMLPVVKDAITTGGKGANTVSLRMGSSGIVETFSGTQLLTTLEDMHENPTSYLELSNHSGVADGNIYGMVLNKIGVAVNEIPLEFEPGAIKTQDVFARKVKIHDLLSAPREVIGITKSAGTTPSVYGHNVQKGPFGDVFRIDVEADTGFYKGDFTAAAQIWCSIHAGKGTVEQKVVDWVSAPAPYIALNDFLNDSTNTYSLRSNGDAMAHSMKGNMGMFLSMTERVKFVNTKILDVKNDSPAISTLDSSKFAQLGGSAHGVLEACTVDTILQKLSIENILSPKGSATKQNWVAKVLV